MFKSFRYSAKQAFSQMFRNRGMSLASVFAMVAMLFILGLFVFLTVNVGYLTESIKAQFDTIEVYLLDETTEEEASVMLSSLESMDEVKSVQYVSKDQAMEEFKQRWGSNAYLLDGLAENPLPNSLRVELANLEGGDMIAMLCRNMIGVEDVKYYKTEIDRILDITETIKKGAVIIIAALLLVAVVVVMNTVKITVNARQREIMIMRDVGATNWFIRGPFLMEGMLIGFISACISSGLCSLLYIKFAEAFNDRIYALFSSNLVGPEFMIFNLVIIFLALGVSIGAVGSMASMRRFLRV